MIFSEVRVIDFRRVYSTNPKGKIPSPKGVTLCILSFKTSDREQLEHYSQMVIADPDSNNHGKSALRQITYNAGRTAAALAFQNLGLKAKLIPHPMFDYLIAQNENQGAMDLHVNISHTEGLAVATVAPAPVGVDVEHSDRSVTRILSRFAVDEEQRSLCSTLCINAPAELALWCAKEAFLKATGLGIKFGLKRVKVNLEVGPLYRVHSDLKGRLRLHAPAIHYEIFEKFVIAVCSEREVLGRGLTLVVARACELPKVLPSKKG